MKLLCIADCHYPKFCEIEKLVKLDSNSFEAILWLGDNDQFLMEEVSLKFKHKLQIGVLGNHDPFKFNVLEEYGINDINLKVFNHNSVNFAGFQGSIKLDSSDPVIGCTQGESIDYLKS